MNLPNKLTLFRILLIPFFIAFALTSNTICRWIALILFIVASLTDLLDGKIARKYQMVTDFGKFMDPLADKLSVCAGLALLVDWDMMSVWALFIIVAREFIVTGLRLIASGNGVVIAAGKSGKAKTMLQMIVLIWALIPLPLGLSYSFGRMTVMDVLVFLMVLITIISGLEYIIVNRKLLLESK